MATWRSRRDFLRTSAGGAAALYGLGGNVRLPAVSANDARLGPKVVPLRPEIEPLVELLESTPRDRLVEKLAASIRQGASYRDVLAALLLAGVRNVQPRPSVGFKFHAVLVVQSVHLASLASADSDRWLPLFWAVDYFKSAQARDVAEGDWTMSAVNEAAVPPPDRAQAALVKAVGDWDEEATDAATAAVARSETSQQVFDLLFRHAARDFRSIGHKAIFAANAHRVIGVIGWQHAEPVLRSLTYAMLQHEDGNPASRDADADLPGRRNGESIRRIRSDWSRGNPDETATLELIATLRDGSEHEAAELTIELLNRGVAPQSVWNGLAAGASELLMRQPGIVSLHAVTTTNAIRYAWRNCQDDETRRFLLLQNASFLPMFRAAMQGRGPLSDRRIDAIEPRDCPPGADGVEAILNEVSSNRASASGETLGYLQSGGSATTLIDAARRVLLLKGDDAHDYKFAGAVFEDFGLLTPPWDDRLLAASTFRIHGAGDRDNPLTDRVREAFR